MLVIKITPKQSFQKQLEIKLLQFLVHKGVYTDVYNLADKLFLNFYSKLTELLLLFQIISIHDHLDPFTCIDLRPLLKQELPITNLTELSKHVWCLKEAGLKN